MMLCPSCCGTFFTGAYSLLLPAVWTLMAVFWVILHCTLTSLRCVKVSYRQCYPIKKECEGCTHCFNILLLYMYTYVHVGTYLHKLIKSSSHLLRNIIYLFLSLQFLPFFLSLKQECGHSGSGMVWRHVWNRFWTDMKRVWYRQERRWTQLWKRCKGEVSWVNKGVESCAVKCGIQEIKFTGCLWPGHKEKMKAFVFNSTLLTFFLALLLSAFLFALSSSSKPFSLFSMICSTHTTHTHTHSLYSGIWQIHMYCRRTIS